MSRAVRPTVIPTHRNLTPVIPTHRNRTLSFRMQRSVVRNLRPLHSRPPLTTTPPPTLNENSLCVLRALRCDSPIHVERPVALLTPRKTPPTINNMTSHKDCQLDRLGITSQQEADELERELDIHFDQFTHYDREVWVQQNAYLDAYALNRTVTESADMAGVTVSNAQGWTYLNTLGFKRRLEIADLRFSDNLQVMALERAREPDAPASLLIALLRAHIPEKFSSNGHVCDTSKADELLFHFSQDALREKNAGHPTFRAIANGTYQPRPPRRNSSPTMPSAVNPPTQTNRHTGGGRYPENAHLDSIQSDQEISSSHEPPSGLPHDDIQPVDSDEVAYYNLSPSDRKNTPHPSAPSAHSAVYPPAQTNRHTGGGRYPENAHPDSI